MTIPFYYDPMIAKMICHAETREAAIEKTVRAIDEFQITGVETTLGFCRFVMNHPAFRSGNFDTNFVEQYFKPELLPKRVSDADAELLAALLAAKVLNDAGEKNIPPAAEVIEKTSAWRTHRT
jgi:propionyl-CoA carboxylase alpha chain